MVIDTANGYGVNLFGKAMANDMASETIDRARRQVEYMSIIDSKVIYTIPVETKLTLNGSPVVAVSAVQEMSSFLDNRGFSSSYYSVVVNKAPLQRLCCTVWDAVDWFSPPTI